jgi:hypothetical protein
MILNFLVHSVADYWRAQQTWSKREAIVAFLVVSQGLVLDIMNY